MRYSKNQVNEIVNKVHKEYAIVLDEVRLNHNNVVSRTEKIYEDYIHKQKQIWFLCSIGYIFVILFLIAVYIKNLNG